jgi:4'-phosphopantetheinyl transferase
MIKDSAGDEWNYDTSRIEIGNDELHVWSASLDQDNAAIQELSALLKPDERQKAERYHKAIDRCRFIVARGVLRRILSAYLHIAPYKLQFVYNEYGKPSLSADQNHCDLSFNLSHSNSMVLYAIAGGRPVGIDIEYIREDFATLEIAEHFFSKDEVVALKSLPTDQRTMGFFNCWSRKEAFIKAKGMGVSYPLDRFTVSLAPGETPALLKVDDDELEVARWRMYELTPAAGYAAALVAPTPPVTLIHRHFVV